MSDSLRDRVARKAMLVHYKPEAVDKEQAANGPSWRDYCRIADALIAAGLVVEPEAEPYVTCTACGSTGHTHIGQCWARCLR